MVGMALVLTMGLYPNEIFREIIAEQSQVIGTKLAHARALLTGGLTFTSPQQHEVALTQDPKNTLSKLVSSYEEIFGEASVDVCLDVIKRMPMEQVSQYLPEDIKQRVG